jgi:hypothetical protein
MSGDNTIYNTRGTCYCYKFPQSQQSFCGCTPYPVFPDHMIVPEGFTVLPTASSWGRFSIKPEDECPNSDFEKQVQAGRAQCLYKGDSASFNIYM